MNSGCAPNAQAYQADGMLAVAVTGFLNWWVHSGGLPQLMLSKTATETMPPKLPGTGVTVSDWSDGWNCAANWPGYEQPQLKVMKYEQRVFCALIAKQTKSRKMAVVIDFFMIKSLKW